MRTHAWGCLALMLVGSGCYRATVVTGATPSTETVSVPWASSWVYGLVPPKTVETAAKCPHGVAKVETHLPFVNMLVGALTLGIYTPMSIEATCAAKAGAASGEVAMDTGISLSVGQESAVTAFAIAAELARQSGDAVYVEVTQ